MIVGLLCLPAMLAEIAGPTLRAPARPSSYVALIAIHILGNVEGEQAAGPSALDACYAS
jgi:hypothetical protein